MLFGYLVTVRQTFQYFNTVIQYFHGLLTLYIEKIQNNKSIYNARMVSRGVLSEARQLLGVRWQGAGLREGTKKIICLMFSLKRGKRRAAANFEREFVNKTTHILKR